MNHKTPSRKFGGSFLVLGSALLLCQMRCYAFSVQQQEQQQSQSQQQQANAASKPEPPVAQTSPSDPPAAKQRKVWTNDDVILLRTPLDDYLAEKEAKQAAAAEAAKEAAARARSEKELPLDIKLPNTPEETEKSLQTARDDIQEETAILGKLRKELLDAPAEQQAGNQKEIDRLAGNIETLQRNAKALQQHLQTLRAKSQTQNPPPPAEPQPPSF